MSSNISFTDYQTIVPAVWLNFVNSVTNNQVMTNIAALRAITTTQQLSMVLVMGYYATGDGGGGIYVANPSDTTSTDNGGSIIVSSSGQRWYLMNFEDTYYVEQFGAKGDGATDDTNAINNAIAALPARGGTVRLRGKTYAVSGTINVGNGHAATTTPSTQTGIRIIGTGGGTNFFGAVPTIIQAKDTGSSTPYINILMSVNGPIDSVYLEGFKLYCYGANSSPTTGSLVNIGLQMTSFTSSTVKNVTVSFATTEGLYILGGSGSTGCYNTHNQFHQVNCTSTINGHVGLLMDGYWPNSNDTWITSFFNCRWDTNSAINATAAYFKFVDSCSFYRCHMVGNNTGGVGLTGCVGAYFNAVGNDQFPSGLCFHDCSILSTTVNEDASHHIRVNTFINHGTDDNEAIPSHPNLRGITDVGHPFNGWGT